MTVSSENRKAGPFSGNDIAATFPFAFRVFSATDIRVVRRGIDGAETDLVLDESYAVTLNEDQNATPGGDVLFVAPPATGETIVITSRIPRTQEAEILNGGGFYPSVVTDALDRVVVAQQEMQEELSRSVRVPITSSDDPAGLADAIVDLSRYGDDIVGLANASVRTDVDQDLTAGQQAKARKNIGIPDAKSYGCVMDGVADDSEDFLSYLNYCETNSVVGVIPEGTLKLSTWATRNSSFVCLRGAGIGRTIIQGPTTANTHFLKMTSGVFDLEGIEFQRFDNVVYSEASVSVGRIHKCKGKQNRSNLYKQADVTDYPSSAIQRLILTNNEIELAGGFHVHGAVTQAVASGNILTNVKRDSSVWVADNPLYQTFGISIGDTDNNASSVAQALTQNIVVSGNNISGMFNATTVGTFNTTNAIQVSAINAAIIGNVVSGMDATDRINNEAIYCKAQNYVISGNAIYGSKTESACIAAKGALTTSGPRQKNSSILGNTIFSEDGLCANAITLFAAGYCDVNSNVIDGMYTDSIKAYGDPYRLSIINNSISNNAGQKAITLPTGSVTSCRIEGNTIDGVLSTTGNLSPISVVSNPMQLSHITVTSGGSGYTSVPTVTVSGGGGTATAQATVSGGAVIAVQVNSSNTSFTSTPTISFSGGGGTGAAATGVLSTGAINDLSISRNKIIWSPRSTLTTACGIFVQSDSTVAAASGGLVLRGNEFIADASANAAVIQGVNIYSATSDWFRDAVIDGLHMTVPDITKCRPMNFNSSNNLIGQASHYDDINITGVFVNGRRQRTLSKFQTDERSFTAVVSLSGKAVGSTLLGYIPYSVLLTHALVFTSAAPTSATSAATIGLSVGSSASYNVLALTAIGSFSANTFKACIPDGTAANAKRLFVSSGLVAVYLEVGVEALTGGQLELVAQTELLQ